MSELRWDEVNFPTSGAQDFCLGRGSDIYAATSRDGVFQSTDDGSNWSTYGLDGQDVMSLCATSEGHLFASLKDGSILRNDKEETWKSLRHPRNIVSSIDVDEEGNIYATYMDTGGLAKSQDGGESWNFFDFSPVGTMLVSTLGSEKALVGASDGSVYLVLTEYNKIYKAGNFESDIISGIHKHKSNTIFVTLVNNGVRRSLYEDEVNGEYLWSDASRGIEEVGVYDIDSNKNGILFIGSFKKGVYASGDFGDNWKQMGLMGATVDSLRFTKKSNLLIGTQESGIFRGVFI